MVTRKIERIRFIDNDRFIDNKLSSDLIDLLSYIRANQGAEILVKKDKELVQNILLKEGTTLNRSKPVPRKKAKRGKKKSISGIEKIVIFIGIILTIIVLFAIIKPNIFLDERNLRIAESIGTDDYGKRGYWSIWRTSFENIEDAIADKNATSTNHRTIKILKLQDERYHLFELGETKSFVEDKLSKRSIEHHPWEVSKIIYIDLNKCTIVKSSYEDCFVCNQFD